MPSVILPYGGIEPEFLTLPEYCADGSAVLGRAKIGIAAVLGGRAVIRADGNYVRVGHDFCPGPRSTVHIAHDVYPTIIGNAVSVGENSVIHACQVGDDVAIGENVVLLDGCLIGDSAIIESGSVVFPRAQIDSGVWAGMPAERVRDFDDGEFAIQSARLRVAAMSKSLEPGAGGTFPGLLFVAPNAVIRGRLAGRGSASVWFGCDFDARSEVIALREGRNIQDNAKITCTSGPVTIGDGTVVGHNVTIESCPSGRIRCLAMAAW